MTLSVKYSKDKYDWLDEMLRSALHAEDVGPDFDAWKKKHPRAIEGVNSNDAATERRSKDPEN